jgi:RNA polymerase sigma-70 factor, ECF subfamily
MAGRMEYQAYLKARRNDMLVKPSIDLDIDRLSKGLGSFIPPARESIVEVIEPSDEELAQRLIGRDFDAFTELYDRHVDVVYALALYMLGQQDSDEAVQEVFLRVWKKRDKYEPRRGLFRPWLLSVARNHFLDLLRRRGLERRLQVAFEIEEKLAAVEDDCPDVADQTVQRQRALAVHDALANIPTEQREVIVLAFFAGLSQSAIAQQLHAPLGTVKKRMRLAMQKLRTNLNQTAIFKDESMTTRKGVGT